MTFFLVLSMLILPHSMILDTVQLCCIALLRSVGSAVGSWHIIKVRTIVLGTLLARTNFAIYATIFYLYCSTSKLLLTHRYASRL